MKRSTSGDGAAPSTGTVCRRRSNAAYRRQPAPRSRRRAGVRLLQSISAACAACVATLDTKTCSQYVLSALLRPLPGRRRLQCMAMRSDKPRRHAGRMSPRSTKGTPCGRLWLCLLPTKVLWSRSRNHHVCSQAHELQNCTQCAQTTGMSTLAFCGSCATGRAVVATLRHSAHCGCSSYVFHARNSDVGQRSPRRGEMQQCQNLVHAVQNPG